jgi:hypothetical protein
MAGNDALRTVKLAKSGRSWEQAEYVISGDNRPAAGGPGRRQR